MSLENEISRYESALKALQDESIPIEEKVSNLLSVRDSISGLINKDAAVTLEQRRKLTAFDQLFQKESSIVQLMDEQTFIRWRNCVQPSADAWWWHINEGQPRAVWSLIAGFSVMASLGLWTVISAKFLAAGADTAGVATVLSQTLFAFIAGSAVTTSGRHVLARILLKVGIKRRSHMRWKAALSILVLLFTILFYKVLPIIANRYDLNGRGLRALTNAHDPSRLQRAIQSFKHAISLNPDFAQAHYNLAEAYEDSFDYANAITAYHAAIQSDADMYPAYNNLARLYILHKNDSAMALKLITKAFTYVQNDPVAREDISIRYTMLKNRGWAYLSLRSYDLARKDLAAAIALDPRIPSGHCLLAKTLESAGEKESAQVERDLCSELGQCDSEEFLEPARGVEPTWCIPSTPDGVTTKK